MGILFCLLSIACFATLYLTVSESQEKGASPYGITVVTFLVGFCLSTASSLPLTFDRFPRKLIGLGLLIGLCAGVGMMGITMAAKSGLSASTINVAAGLALAVPVVAALIVYREAPTGKQWIGLFFTGIAIYLMQGGSR
jgi:drug/metabolite transporter (DMT)-like permease